MIARLNEALRSKRSDLENDQKGFTLVELLVVVLIIGILAAIAIPFFLNQREGAWEGQVKSDIANAVIAAETYAISQGGTYDGLAYDNAANTGTLKDNGYAQTDNVLITVTPTTSTGATKADGYTIRGTHALTDEVDLTYSSLTGKTSNTTP